MSARTPASPRPASRRSRGSAGPRPRPARPSRRGAPPDASPIVGTVPVRRRERYRKEVVPRLRERFRYRNVMEVPRLEKVVVNVRVGDATTDKRFVDKAGEERTHVAGQR